MKNIILLGLILLLSIFPALADPDIANIIKSLPHKTTGEKNVINENLESIVIIHHDPSDSYGTGVIIDDRGYILTCKHIVNHDMDWEDIRVNLYPDEDKSYNISFIWSLDLLDISILKIDVDRKLRPIKMGQSHKTVVGERVYLISNPVYHAWQVTDGIISDLRYSEIGFRMDFIIASTPIQHGSSGGALLNEQGEMIGIIFSGVMTWTFTRTSIFGSINYFMAIDTIRPFAWEIILAHIWLSNRK